VTAIIEAAIARSKKREEEAQERADLKQGKRPVRLEYQFRDAMELLAFEVMLLAPARCDCHGDLICPRCRVEGTFCRVDRILEGGRA
jgi:hypothetical protein